MHPTSVSTDQPVAVCCRLWASPSTMLPPRRSNRSAEAVTRAPGPATVQPPSQWIGAGRGPGGGAEPTDTAGQGVAQDRFGRSKLDARERTKPHAQAALVRFPRL